MNSYSCLFYLQCKCSAANQIPAVNCHSSHVVIAISLLSVQDWSEIRVGFRALYPQDRKTMSFSLLCTASPLQREDIDNFLNTVLSQEPCCNNVFLIESQGAVIFIIGFSLFSVSSQPALQCIAASSEIVYQIQAVKLILWFHDCIMSPLQLESTSNAIPHLLNVRNVFLALYDPNNDACKHSASNNILFFIDQVKIS